LAEQARELDRHRGLAGAIRSSPDERTLLGIQVRHRLESSQGSFGADQPTQGVRVDVLINTRGTLMERRDIN